MMIKLSPISPLLLLLAAVVVPPPAIVVEAGDCEFPFDIGGGVNRFNSYPGWFTEDNLASGVVSATDAGTCTIAESASGTDPVVGMWFYMTVPGNATSEIQEYPLSFRTYDEALVGDTAMLTVYEGGCDALICAPTQVTTVVSEDGVTDNGLLVEWTGVANTTYYILYSAVQTENFVNYASGQLLKGDLTPLQMCAINTPPVDNYHWNFLESQCQCVENEDGSVDLYCADDCETCSTPEVLTWINGVDPVWQPAQGELICHTLEAFQIFLPDETAIGASGVVNTDCFTFQNGPFVGEKVCMNQGDDYTNCTFTINDITCNSCYVGLTDECGYATQLDCTNIDIGVNNVGTFNSCDEDYATPVTNNEGILGEYWGASERYLWSSYEQGRCGDEIGATTEAETADDVLQLGEVFGPFTVMNGTEEFFLLDTTGVTAGKHIRCLMDGDGTDPDLRIRENDIESWAIAFGSKYGPKGDARAMVRNDTAIYVSVINYEWYAPAENMTLFCETYDANLDIGIPSEQFGLDEDQIGWFLLDVSGREEGELIKCIMDGPDSVDPDVNVRINTRDNETVACSITNVGSAGDCILELTNDVDVLWLEVYEYLNREADNITVMCYPEYDVDQFLLPGVDSLSFNVTDDPATFAMELGAGDVAFCHLKSATGDYVNGTYYDLFLGLDTPPDLELNTHFCHSENFWSDFEDICFAFGNVYDKSVVYATVVATGEVETVDDELVLDCARADEISLGWSSWSFDLEQDEYRSFFVDVPQGTTEIVCTTEADNGDIDLYMKTGSNLLSSGFDCVELSDNSFEECTLTIPPILGSTEPVFGMVFAHGETTNARYKCEAITEEVEEEVATSKQENPDLWS